MALLDALVEKMMGHPAPQAPAVQQAQPAAQAPNGETQKNWTGADEKWKSILYTCRVSL